jgi:hypothetical protein
MARDGHNEVCHISLNQPLLDAGFCFGLYLTFVLHMFNFCNTALVTCQHCHVCKQSRHNRHLHPVCLPLVLDLVVPCARLEPLPTLLINHGYALDIDDHRIMIVLSDVVTYCTPRAITLYRDVTITEAIIYATVSFLSLLTKQETRTTEARSQSTHSPSLVLSMVFFLFHVSFRLPTAGHMAPSSHHQFIQDVLSG